MGVVADQCFTVVEAVLQRGPATWVQRSGLWSATQPNPAPVVVDVVVGEVLQFLGSRGVQQGGQPDEG